MSSIRTTRAAPDIATIERALTLLAEPGQVVELRVPKVDGRKTQTASGYFTDMHALATAATKFQQPRNIRAAGVYITLNQCDSALFARCGNRVADYAEQTTADHDVTRRRWFPIDCDPDRAAGIGATDEEHVLALAKAQCITAYLAERGWPLPLSADSGNGGHELYRIDLTNTPEHAQLLQRCLDALSKRFSDDRVKVDTTVFNAARIWKLYGTVAAKGDDTEDRPHRVATLLDVPATLEPVPYELLAALAAELDVAGVSPKATVPSNPLRANITESPVTEWTEDYIKAWPAKHGLATSEARTWNTDGWKMEFDQCPFSDAHTDGAFIGQRSKGGPIVANCRHDTCSGKEWADLRARYDPKLPPDPKHGLLIPTKNKAQSPGERAVATDVITPPVRFWLTEDEIEMLRPPTWLIKGIVPAGEVTMMTGPGDSGKTFIALDMAARVAQHYRVMYIAAEDAPGIRIRKQAWQRANERPSNGNFLMMDSRLDLSSDVAVAHYIVGVQLLSLRLIIIDTLSQSSLGVEENSNSEMSLVMARCEKIAHETGAAVLLLHHTPKNGEGWRGASVIKDNTYAHLQVAKDDETVRFECNRIKNAKPFPARFFKLRQIETSILDEQEQPITSCVIVPASRVLVGNHLTRNQIKMLESLAVMTDALGGAKTTELQQSCGLVGNSFYSALKRLRELNLALKGDSHTAPITITAEGRERLAQESNDPTVQSAEAAGVPSAFEVNVHLEKMLPNATGSIEMLPKQVGSISDDLPPQDTPFEGASYQNATDGLADCDAVATNATKMLPSASGSSPEILPPSPSALAGEDGSNGSNETDDDAEDKRLITTTREDIQHGRFPLARSVMSRISDPIRRTALEREIDLAEHAALTADTPTVAAPVVMDATDAEQDDLNLIKRVNVLIDKGRLDLALQRVDQLISPALKAEWQQKIHDAQSVGAV